MYLVLDLFVIFPLIFLIVSWRYDGNDSLEIQLDLQSHYYHNLCLQVSSASKRAISCISILTGEPTASRARCYCWASFCGAHILWVAPAVCRWTLIRLACIMSYSKLELFINFSSNDSKTPLSRQPIKRHW